MIRILHWPLIAILLALPLAGSLAWSEEPKTDAPPSRLADVEVVLTDVDAHVLLLNVMQTANGLEIDVAPAEAALRAQLGLEEGSGLVVTSAPKESIGVKAGLQLHDVIVQVGENKVGDTAKLRKLLDAADGKPVKFHVLRGGKRREVEAIPMKSELAQIRLSVADALTSVGTVLDQDRYRIGVHLAEADDTLRTQLRLAAGEGLVVTDVVKDGAAAKAGIQKHDVLTVLDGKRLTSVESINSQIQEIKDRQVELRLLRSGQELSIRIAPRKTREADYGGYGLGGFDMYGMAGAGEYGMMAGAGIGYGMMAGGYGGPPARGGQPRQQIDALKRQLDQVQKTLAALEAALNTAAVNTAEPPAAEEPADKKKE